MNLKKKKNIFKENREIADYNTKLNLEKSNDKK